MENAYGYIRVSGKGQISGDGFKRQTKAIEDYALKHKILIDKVYKEKGVSGTLEHRPALADLLLDLEQNGNGIKTVIIEKVDRLARDLMVQENIIADLKKKGFNLISVSEGSELLSNDPTRKLVRQVLGAIAEYDKTMTVQKLRSARKRKKALNGKCEGRKGYRELMPEVVATVKKLRRKRKGQARLSYAKIADQLNTQGFLTMTGQAWKGQNVQDLLRIN